MAKTFGEMVSQARSEVEVLSPEDAQRRMRENAKTLVVDVRESAGRESAIPGAINVPLGVLPIKADTELPSAVTDERLQDRDQPVIVTCGAGGQAALGAKMLKDMGFTNVSMVDGGMRGWTAADLPTEKPE